MVDNRNYVLLIPVASSDDVVLVFPPFVTGLKEQNFFVSAVVEFYGVLELSSVLAMVSVTLRTLLSLERNCFNYSHISVEMSGPPAHLRSPPCSYSAISSTSNAQAVAWS